MIASPLQLADFEAATLAYERLEADPPPDDAEMGVGLSIEMDAAFEEDRDVQRLQLDIRYNNEEDVPEEAAPYIAHRGHVRVTGWLYWASEEVAAREDAERLLLTNGLSMLYGIARVRVADLTADGRDRRLVLPSVNFQPAVQQWLEENESEESGE
jgi:preprotein translocase subunit SecB